MIWRVEWHNDVRHEELKDLRFEDAIDALLRLRRAWGGAGELVLHDHPEGGFFAAPSHCTDIRRGCFPRIIEAPAAKPVSCGRLKLVKP